MAAWFFWLVMVPAFLAIILTVVGVVLYLIAVARDADENGNTFHTGAR